MLGLGVCLPTHWITYDSITCYHSHRKVLDSLQICCYCCLNAKSPMYCTGQELCAVVAAAAQQQVRCHA